MYFDSRNKDKVLIELTEPQTELCISISGDNLAANNITLLPKACMTKFRVFLCSFTAFGVWQQLCSTESCLLHVCVSCVSLALSRSWGGTIPIAEPVCLENLYASGLKRRLNPGNIPALDLCLEPLFLQCFLETCSSCRLSVGPSHQHSYPRMEAHGKAGLNCADSLQHLDFSTLDSLFGSHLTETIAVTKQLTKPGSNLE